MSLFHRTILIRHLLFPPAAENRGVPAPRPRPKSRPAPGLVYGCFGFARPDPDQNRPQPPSDCSPHSTTIDHCFPIADLCAAV